MELHGKKIMMLATTDNMLWQFLLPHIKYLQEKGCMVECVCHKTGFWFDELKNNFGLKMHDIEFERSPLNIKNYKALKKLYKLQEKEKYDIVYCQQPVGGMMGRLVSKKFKIPCIYTAHGFHFFKGNSKIKNFIFRNVEKYLAKYTDALITINDEDFNACREWKAKRKYKISGIGFDFNKYEKALSNREIKKELNISDEFVILTVAEFIKRKNYDTMLKTIAKLKDENIKFLVCGTGRDKLIIEEQIKNLNIEDKVQLLGYRKDINNLMTISNAFFLPSHQEGLTLSIIEALNFGLPVVTSDVRGNKDLVDDGVGGFVCDQNDYNAFAEKFKLLIKDANLCKSMSVVNLKNAKKYDIDNVKKELEKIYMEM
jgi:glycosyltransferase involved in cell wall biosynthesis